MRLLVYAIVGAGFVSFPASARPVIVPDIGSLVELDAPAGPVTQKGLLQLAQSGGNSGGSGQGQGQGQGQGGGQGNSGSAPGSDDAGDDAADAPGSDDAGDDAADAPGSDDAGDDAADGTGGSAPDASDQGSTGSDPGSVGTPGGSVGAGPSSPGTSAPPDASGISDPDTVGSITSRGNGGDGVSGLPSALSPSADNFVAPGFRGRRAVQPARQALAFVPGTPVEIVWACREAVVAAARPHGVVQVDASSVGVMQRDADGNMGAPLEVRIIYGREGGNEIKQARINCRLDSRRTVTGLQ